MLSLHYKFIKMDYRKEIKKRGLMQGFIANKLGIDQAYFSQILSGKRPMKEQTRKKLNKILFGK